MRRFGFAAAAAGITLLAASSAFAYDVDPVTRQPIAPFGTDGRTRATPIPRETIDYKGPHRAGTVIVSTKERRLYLVLANGKAIKYGAGIGRPGFEWGGSMAITRKAEWPDWRPPPQMLKRRPDLPKHMPGGLENPLGARALYLGSTLYRIHGSNEPETIGQAVSSGCVRMLNEDVIDLYSKVRVGTRVVVVR